VGLLSRAGQGRAGLDRAGQGRAGQGRAGQGRACYSGQIRLRCNIQCHEVEIPDGM